MDKKIAVFGMYRTRQDVEQTVQTLKSSDFRNADISVLFSESAGTRILRMKNILKFRKAPRLELGPAR